MSGDLGFVNDLCLALGHRVELGRKFMILTAYFDESGTHGGSDTCIMAGFVGSVAQWRKYEKRVGKLFRRSRVDVFHAIDVRRGDKDFKGWTVDRKVKFLDEFYHIINETVELGVISILKEADYKYYLELFRPRKAKAASRYAILFRSCLAALIERSSQKEDWTKNIHKLGIVVEDGCVNVNDAVRLHKEFSVRNESYKKMMPTITFASKQGCLPIASVDLYAYSVYGMETGQKPVGTLKSTSKADSSYRGNIWHNPVRRDILDVFHKDEIGQANLRALRVLSSSRSSI
jgi:hypothetical protein